jgi:hypothetical protein
MACNRDIFTFTSIQDPSAPNEALVVEKLVMCDSNKRIIIIITELFI